MLVGCTVEGTIESCAPDGGCMVELRTGEHIMRGAQFSANPLLYVLQAHIQNMQVYSSITFFGGSHYHRLTSCVLMIHYWQPTGI